MQTVVVVFSAAGQRFALALSQVERVVEAVATTPLAGAPVGVLGFFDLRGVLVPVLDVFSGGRRGAGDISVHDRFLIVNTGARTVALVVEEVHGVLETSVAPISSIEGLRLDDSRYAGVTRTDDGLVLIHDVEKFMSAPDALALDDALRSVA